MDKSKKSSWGFTRAEFLLTAIGAIGVPVTGGVWVGTLHHQVQQQEQRLDKVETAPLTIAVLENKVDNLTMKVEEIHQDVKKISEDKR